MKFAGENQYSGNPPSTPDVPAQAAGGGAPSYPRGGYSAAYAAPVDAEPGQNFFDPREVLSIVLGHWPAVLICLVLGVGAGAAYCVLAKRIYRAQCRFEIFQERRLQIGTQSTLDRLSSSLGRHIALMKSRTLQRQVIEKLRPKWKDRLSPDDFYVDVTIEPVREARRSMLDVRVDAADGEYAREYLNALIEGYLEIRRQESQEANENAVRNLRIELDRLSQEMEDAQNQLIKFQEEHNVQLSAAQEAYDEMFVTKLLQRQNAIRMERTILESQFPFLKNADAATIRDVLALTLETHAATAPGSLIIPTGGGPGGRAAPLLVSTAQAAGGGSPWPERQDWQEQEELVARLEAEYQDNLKVYKPGHPKMVELKRRLDAARRDLKLKAEIAMKRLQARYEALKMQEEALNKAVGAWKSSLKLSASERATYETLQSKAEHLRRLYDQVYQRVIDATAETVDRHFSRVVEAPEVLPEPIWPAKFKIMAAATVLSLGLGLGLAFLLYMFETRFVDIASIEQRLGVPYLCGIPLWDRVVKGFRQGKLQVVMSHDEANNPATEAYRTLRMSLEQILENGKPYVLAVTSGDSGEGKSFTSINLAVAFAWTGRKVLLVDGDLRKPAVHRVFKRSGRVGLADLLIGTVRDPQSVVQPTDIKNLSILPAGRFRPEIPELISVSRITQLLDTVRQEYDLIVIDTAPIGRIADTMAIAKAVDGVLLVAKHGRTTYADVRHALRRLAAANVIGFCVNAIDLPRGPRGYYHGYGYYPRRYEERYAADSPPSEDTAPEEAAAEAPASTSS